MAAPKRARLTKEDAEKIVCIHDSEIGLRYWSPEETGLAGADKAWDMCRAEAIEAMEGLVTAAQEVWDFTIGKDGSVLDNRLPKALAKCQKWVQKS